MWSAIRCKRIPEGERQNWKYEIWGDRVPAKFSKLMSDITPPIQEAQKIKKAALISKKGKHTYKVQITVNERKSENHEYTQRHTLISPKAAGSNV